MQAGNYMGMLEVWNDGSPNEGGEGYNKNVWRLEGSWMWMLDLKQLVVGGIGRTLRLRKIVQSMMWREVLPCPIAGRTAGAEKIDASALWSGSKKDIALQSNVRRSLEEYQR